MSDIDTLLRLLKPRISSWIAREVASIAWPVPGVDGYPIIPLTTPLTSANFTATAYASTSKTLITMSTEFGMVTKAKLVLMRVSIRDSGSSGTDCVLTLGPTNATGVGPAVNCLPTNDRWNRVMLPVPCNSDGNIYFEVVASGGSGTATMDVTLQVWGYCKK